MTQIGQNVVLSQDTQIGQNVTIGHNVVIYPNVTIEDDVTIFDGAVIGRQPKATSTITRQVGNSYRPLVIGKGSIVGANAVLYTGIAIGKNVLIGDLASIREGCLLSDEIVIGRSVLIMYDTIIGARTRIIDGAILTGSMLVEEDVFIGPGFNSINDNDVYLKRFGLQPFEVKGPRVRRFSLLGTGSNIAANIEVGMGAIVAPGAMVTKDVAPWTVVAGFPAKYVRDVDADKRQQILKLFGLEELI